MRFTGLVVVFFISCFLIDGHASAQEDYEYLIRVSVSQRMLFLSKYNNEQEMVAAFLIGAPKFNYPTTPICGEITSIELNPSWYPTLNTRAAYLEKEGIDLPEIIRPNDPRNAMGKAKINLRLDGIRDPIKIHGTNKPQLIGQRVSRGCIRLKNEDIVELVNILKDRRTKVIFEN